MKFKEINAFRTVMRSGSMTAAAEALYTSQPNVSRLISQLEASTGLMLFTRTPGRLVPTEEAFAFLREVDRAFVGLDALKDSARNIRHFGKGRLRIATVPSLAMTILPLVLQRFHASHPEVTVAMDTGSTQLVTDLVASQTCDLGLVSYLPASGIAESKPIFDIAGCCILPPGHRLTQKAFIEPSDLAGESFISMAHGDGLRARIDAAFAEDDRRILHFETPHGSTICQMVGLGLGVGIVNPLVAAKNRHTGIEIRPFLPRVSFVSYLLLARNRPFNSMVDRLCSLIDEIVAVETDGLS